MVFPARLKALRLEKGLSQRELGGIVGLKPQTISHYETGYRNPSTSAINHLCDYFKVTSDYLLGRSEYRQYPSNDIRTITDRLIKEIQEAVRKADKNLKNI